DPHRFDHANGLEERQRHRGELTLTTTHAGRRPNAWSAAGVFARGPAGVESLTRSEPTQNFRGSRPWRARFLPVVASFAQVVSAGSRTNRSICASSRSASKLHRA